MAFYRIDKDISDHPTGENVVHREDCKGYSIMKAFGELGYHSNSRSALQSAKNRGYSSSVGCTICMFKAKK